MPEIGFSVREEPRMIDDSAYRTCDGLLPDWLVSLSYRPHKPGLRAAGDPQGYGCRLDVPKAQLDDFLTNIGLTLGRRMTYTPRHRVLGSIPSGCGTCVGQLWPFTIAVFAVRLRFCRNYQFK